MAEFMVRYSPDGSSMLGFMNAAYGDDAYWKKHKKEMIDSLICTIEQKVYPGLSGAILFKDAATPLTLQRYTSNYRGASYGWAGIASQFALPDLRKPSFMQNLYLTGHWSTLGVGISGTAYVGYDTAKIILRKENSHFR